MPSIQSFLNLGVYPHDLSTIRQNEANDKTALLGTQAALYPISQNVIEHCIRYEAKHPFSVYSLERIPTPPTDFATLSFDDNTPFGIHTEGLSVDDSIHEATIEEDLYEKEPPVYRLVPGVQTHSLVLGYVFTHQPNTNMDIYDMTESDFHQYFFYSWL